MLPLSLLDTLLIVLSALSLLGVIFIGRSYRKKSKQLRQVQAQLSVKIQERDALFTRFSKLESEFSSLSTHDRDQQGQLTKLLSNYRHLNKQCDDQARRIKKLRVVEKHLAEVISQKALLEEALKTAESEKSQKIAELKDTLEKLTHTEQKFHDEERGKRKIEEQYELVLAGLQEKHVRQEELNVRIQQLEEELEALKASTASASLKSASLKKALTISPGTKHRKDDLKQIHGIGPFIEEKLNATGIYTFLQISSLSEADIQKIAQAIGVFPGRMKRDRWIEQAQELQTLVHVT